VAEQLKPRREQPAFRVGAYLIFAALLGVTLSSLGLGGWVFPIYLLVGITETITTTVRMVRRNRKARRLGPSVEWID
jgi:hypothetical protein